MDVEKIYEQKKAELQRETTEQAIRLEKIKTLAAEFGFAVDNTLTDNVTAKRAELEKQNAELESELESVTAELEKTRTV